MGDWDDDSGWLAALAPLRADLLGGDQRLFYLFWLMAVECEVFRDETPEPLPGLGPLSPALAAFVEFFGIDRDFAEAAAERTPFVQSSPERIRGVVAAIGEDEKTALLLRLLERDPHVAGELAHRVKAASANGSAAVEPRTVGELRARAAVVRANRLIAAQEAAAAEQARRDAEKARALDIRLNYLKRRGDGVWREIETEIERRNASGYDAAAKLLCDLGRLAEKEGTGRDFTRRVDSIRTRHASKRTFVQRLDTLDA